jgi:hypothetical protein
MPIQTKPLAPKWRDVLTIHPAAELFPRMTPDELRALGDDIKKNGLHVPVALWRGHAEDGDTKMYVIDGVNRLDAMETVGIAFDDMKGFQTMKPETDPYAFAISMNIERRHLNAEQKRDLIAKVIKAKPDTSNNAIAKQVKADDKTVASVRREMEARSEIPNVSTRTDSSGRGQPARKTRKPTRPPAAPPPTADGQAIRDAAATRVQAPVSGQPEPQAALKPPADDIGPNGVAEAERLRVRVEELQAQVRQRDIKITGLESEIEELRGKLATGTGGNMSISEFQTAIKKWEDTVETQKNIIRDLQNENAKLRAGVAAPPPDDGLDIPKNLLRAKPREMAQ